MRVVVLVSYPHKINSSSLNCDCRNFRGFPQIAGHIWTRSSFSPIGDEQSASVLLRAEAEATVRVRVFDVRGEEERLGVRAGAATDGGRV